MKLKRSNEFKLNYRHGCAHFGGFVFFSRPHATLMTVLPHLEIFFFSQVNNSMNSPSSNLYPPTFDRCLSCARITRSMVTQRRAFMFSTRQRFSTNFIARWTLVVAAFSTARMLVTISHLFAFRFAEKRFGAWQLFGVLTASALFSNYFDALESERATHGN